MSAGGANVGGIGANNDVTAVTAFPNLNFALLENFSGFYVAEKRAISLLVMLFNCSNQTELFSQLVEAFLIGDLGKSCVHIGPLVVFTLSSSAEVLSGVTQTVELFEPQLSVFFLIVGSLEEQGSDLLIALFLCNGCKERGLRADRCPVPQDR